METAQPHWATWSNVNCLHHDKNISFYPAEPSVTFIAFVCQHLTTHHCEEPGSTFSRALFFMLNTSSPSLWWVSSETGSLCQQQFQGQELLGLCSCWVLWGSHYSVSPACLASEWQSYHLSPCISVICQHQREHLTASSRVCIYKDLKGVVPLNTGASSSGRNPNYRKLCLFF